MPTPARSALPTAACAILAALGCCLPATATAAATVTATAATAAAAARPARAAHAARAKAHHNANVRARRLRARRPAPPKLTAANWSQSEQRQVVAAGVMTPSAPASATWSRPLSATQLHTSLLALSDRLTPAPSVSDSAPITALQVPASQPTIVSFDAALVDQLGLGDIAASVQRQAARAGLGPPSYFGSEVVARFLGLRHMQPTSAEALEPYPSDPITRAEAAFSFARILRLSGWDVDDARSTLGALELPTYDAAQRSVLSLAVSKIGMPYIWGGTTDDTSDGLPHGGYDCSGFVWRVYKVSGLPWGRLIQGRTAAQQAGEIPRSQRLRLANVRGGDLLFFGSAHFNDRASEASIVHEGIALSPQWAIDSSGQGVTVEPLGGSWLGQSFAWGRRVL